MRVSIWRFGAARSQGVGWPSLKRGENVQTAKTVRTSKHHTAVGVSGKEISSVVPHRSFLRWLERCIGKNAALLLFLFRLVFVQSLSM
ncbi:MAG: hypothetical protein QOH41_2456 [Blastocatellia bacterium]|jgi:hypothetical protein|nr:hypothetical protein [Blastocatellia bacterium]